MLGHHTFTRRGALLALAGGLHACVTTPVPEPPVPVSAVPMGELMLIAPTQRPGAYRGGDVLRGAVARVHDTAYRLRSHSVGLCGPKRVAQSGIVVCNAWALQALGLSPSAAGLDVDDRLAVLHVVADSPAALSGLRSGDILERVDADAVPVGPEAFELLRAALGGEAATLRTHNLQVRRDGATHSMDLRPQAACDMAAVLSSDHLLAWSGGEVALVEAPDALIAFGLAHGAALRLIAPRRGLAIGVSDIGEGIDVTLSMFSLALGLVTLGGWPAKEVDIFRGSAGTSRAETEARLRDEAELTADALALRMLREAGIDAEPLFAVWQAAVDLEGQAGMRHRLQRMREQWAGLVAGRGGR